MNIPPQGPDPQQGSAPGPYVPQVLAYGQQPLGTQERKDQTAVAKAYAKSQRNWVLRHKFLSAVGSLLIIVIIIVAASSSGGSRNVPAANDPAVTTAAADPASAPAQAAGTLLLSVTGNGNNQTKKFTAAGDWDISYTYDCTQAFDGTGEFSIEVYGSDASLSLTNDGPDEQGAQGSSVTHNHHGGTYYLSINSECSWTVTVTSA